MGAAMTKESEPVQIYKLNMIRRELEAMSDWELERACAAALSFDLDRRIIADRILRERHGKTERGGVAFWTLVASAAALGAAAIAFYEG